MDGTRPALRSRLIVIEPFVPEDQVEREVFAIGPNEGYEPTWVFESTEPLGWDGPMTTRILLAPRTGTAWTRPAEGPTIVQGALWLEDSNARYRGLIAELHPIDTLGA